MQRSQKVPAILYLQWSEEATDPSFADDSDVSSTVDRTSLFFEVSFGWSKSIADDCSKCATVETVWKARMNGYIYRTGQFNPKYLT